jgi:tRNA-(ms[2]io[6]A)-hydroxylase
VTELLARTLQAATPSSWFDAAAVRWRELLVDHANCEKKAASTALSLIFSYPEDAELCSALSRLAREELRHFEQVQSMMRQLEVPFARMSPSRYADGLRRVIRRDEPGRLIDLLVCGALIEARSCERFEGLRGRLPQPLDDFYADLARSEARHHLLYVRLCEQRYGAAECMAAMARLAPVEADLATSSDVQFRFHSGAPAGAALTAA